MCSDEKCKDGYPLTLGTYVKPKIKIFICNLFAQQIHMSFISGGHPIVYVKDQKNSVEENLHSTTMKSV